MRISEAASLACVLEATARKPGNVHRDHDHVNLSYLQLLASAAAIGPAFARVESLTVGRIILEAITATQVVATTNTNLGIVLLLAPLAKAHSLGNWRTYVGAVLRELTLDDCRRTYEAIRIAKPGGLGGVERQDVSAQPSATLLEAMQLAAERDSIARQYANGFAEVLAVGVNSLHCELSRGRCVETALVLTSLRFLIELPDSLIARKFSLDFAAEISTRAALVMDNIARLSDSQVMQHPEFTRFDQWLSHNRLNPGTTADLTTAALFCALLDDTIPLNRPFGPQPAP